VPDLLIFFIALPLITSIRVANLFYILASIVNLPGTVVRKYF
jgi:hypothetical protein